MAERLGETLVAAHALECGGLLKTESGFEPVEDDDGTQPTHQVSIQHGISGKTNVLCGFREGRNCNLLYETVKDGAEESLERIAISGRIKVACPFVVREDSKD